MALKRLLIFHALITLLASLVLVIFPALIPGTVGIKLAASHSVLCYLLAAAELSMAFLSWQARRLKDVPALQIIIYTFIIFHLATAALEMYALMQGIDKALIGNIAARMVISALFYYWGIVKIRDQRRQM
jgi:prepilin signal peptidase PulO-like enzyme (type II secretory pathway)